MVAAAGLMRKQERKNAMLLTAVVAVAENGVIERTLQSTFELSIGTRQQQHALRGVALRVVAVVLLDEPYTGLDEAGASALRDALRSLRSGGAALVLVTHHLSEGLALATHTAIMRDGQFVQHEPRGDVAVDRYRDVYREVVGR